MASFIFWGAGAVSLEAGAEVHGGAAFDWSVGGCCCVDAGPWDWYYDMNGYPATVDTEELPTSPNTPYFARCPSIYPTAYGLGGTQFLPADQSYLPDDSNFEWHVTIPITGKGAYFQSKVMVSSITPSGLTGSEQFYSYVYDGNSQKKFIKVIRSSTYWTAPEDTDEVIAICIGPGGGGAGTGLGGGDGGLNGGGGGGGSAIKQILFTAGTGFGLSVTVGTGGAGGTVGDGSDGSGNTIIDSGGPNEVYGEPGLGGTSSAGGAGGSGAGDTFFDGGAGFYFGTGDQGGGGGGGAGSGGDGASATDRQGATGGIPEGSYDPDALDTGGAGGDGGLDTEDGDNAIVPGGGGGGAGTDGVGGNGADGIVVLIYYSSTTITHAMICVDAASQSVTGIVLDEDWEKYGYEPMGGITISIFSEQGTLHYEDLCKNAIEGCEQNAAYSGGLLRWRIDNVLQSWEKWTISTIGASAYSSGSYVDFDVWPYSYEGFAGYDGDTGDKDVTGDLIIPIATSSQANRALGFKYLHNFEFPDTNDEYLNDDTWTIQPAIELYLGSIVLDGVYPTVDGSLLWSIGGGEIPVTGGGKFSLQILADARIDWFDASSDGYAVVISYLYCSEWEDTGNSPPADVTQNKKINGATALLISGSSTVEDIFEVDDIYGTPTYNLSIDQRDYYPKWHGPRVLHSSEEGGIRTVVFFRQPFGPGDIGSAGSQFNGETILQQWELRCFTSGSLSHSFMGRWDQPSSNGYVDFPNTKSVTQLPLEAILGGDADGYTGTVTINIIDGPVEGTTFSGGTLNVTVDISGGHDTWGELGSAINAGPDFVASAASNPYSLFNSDAVGSGVMAANEVTLDLETDTLTTQLEFVSHPQGDNSGARGNITLNVVVNDGVPETTEFSGNTLTVTLDITGGHNTMADLRTVIGSSPNNGTGDFWFNYILGGEDIIIINASTSGSGALTGGYQEALVTYNPMVLDSSDRFYYLTGFPMRIMVEYENRVRAAYSNNWQISHDGEVVNPVGAGLRHDRENGGTFTAPLSGFSCIKNSDIVTLAPEKEEL